VLYFQKKNRRSCRERGKGRIMETNTETGESKRVYTEAEIADENKRIRHLRRLVDFSLSLIAQTPMSFDEAQRVVEGVRDHACRLFPGKGDTFDLIYRPRFRRLIAEKYRLL